MQRRASMLPMAKLNLPIRDISREIAKAHGNGLQVSKMLRKSTSTRAVLATVTRQGQHGYLERTLTSLMLLASLMLILKTTQRLKLRTRGNVNGF